MQCHAASNATNYLLYTYSPYSFTPLLLYSFTPLLLYSFTPLLLYSFTPLLLYSFTPLLLYSFTPLLLYSFTPLLLSCCIGERGSRRQGGWRDDKADAIARWVVAAAGAEGGERLGPVGRLGVDG